MAFIEMKGIAKEYGKGDSMTTALAGIDLKINQGQFVSVMGPSGSGKSTLLNLLGCMDICTEGTYTIENKSVMGLNNKQLSCIRNQTISFIFQHFALLNEYTVYENIELPLNCRRMSRKEKKKVITYYMKRLGIEELQKKKPTQISGGQQQRVAIARALVTNADIILADEPTGALDQKTGKELLQLLCEINKEGKTIIMVTHDPDVAAYADRKIEIRDGRMVSDILIKDKVQ